MIYILKFTLMIYYWNLDKNEILTIKENYCAIKFFWKIFLFIICNKSEFYSFFHPTSFLGLKNLCDNFAYRKTNVSFAGPPFRIHFTSEFIFRTDFTFRIRVWIKFKALSPRLETKKLNVLLPRFSLMTTDNWDVQ